MTKKVSFFLTYNQLSNSNTNINLTVYLKVIIVEADTPSFKSRIKTSKYKHDPVTQVSTVI